MLVFHENNILVEREKNAFKMFLFYFFPKASVTNDCTNARRRGLYHSMNL